MLIGLCGYAQSGKTSAANILRDIAGFDVVGFADPLRELALTVNPIVGFDGHVDYTENPPRALLDPVSYTQAIQRRGYEGAKLHSPIVREFLQHLGTGVRDVLGADVWVAALYNRLGERIAVGDHIAIADVRFPNEAAMVQEWGQLWRIVRTGTGPGTCPANDHCSETNQETFTVAAELRAANLDELRDAVTAAWRNV